MLPIFRTDKNIGSLTTENPPAFAGGQLVIKQTTNRHWQTGRAHREQNSICLQIKYKENILKQNLPNRKKKRKFAFSNNKRNTQQNMKKIINTPNAPAAIGPYSQAVQAGNTLYISGQIPINPATKEVPEGITAQTEQVMQNIKAILDEAGYTFQDVVKSTCLLADMEYFKPMNEVYAKYYNTDCPARAAFAVKGLPMGVLVEIETIAVK